MRRLFLWCSDRSYLAYSIGIKVALIPTRRQIGDFLLAIHH